MDEQDAQRKAESGLKTHEYNPEKANGGSSQPTARSFEGKQQAQAQAQVRTFDSPENSQVRARTSETEENVQPRARTFDSQENAQSRVRTFDSQENAGQSTQERSQVAKVSVETSKIGAASLAHVFLAWQREMYWFVNSRMDKNIQFLRQLSDKGGPGDFGRYAQEAITDYTFGVQQVVARSLSAAQKGGEDMRHGAEGAVSQLRSSQERPAGRD